MNVVVVGLGSMGYGAASNCAKAGLNTWGFDLNPATVDRFNTEFGQGTRSWDDIETIDALVLFVVNAQQAQSVLFDSPAMAKLSSGAAVINCVTIPPSKAVELAEKVSAAGFGYVDAPVSGGAAKAASGEMSIMASGAAETMASIKPVFDAISANVFDLGSEPGNGSRMKLINQLLAGVHIASTAEALNMAASYDMDLQQVFEIITKCAGNSWMWENRGPHIVNGDYTPLSTVDIFVKDMGIVTDEASLKGVETPLSKTALALYQEASQSGLGLEDDSAIVKILAEKSGIKVPGMKS